MRAPLAPFDLWYRFPAWCRGVARNLVLHYWRARQRSKEVPSDRYLELVERSQGELNAGGDYGKAVIDHVAFRCSDSEGMAARLREHGIQYAVSEVPALGDLQFFFRDPLGNGVELSFRRATGAGDG